MTTPPTVKPLKAALLTELTAYLRPAGFVRSGQTFRHVAANGNTIVLELQGSFPLSGESEFYLNVAVVHASTYTWGPDGPGSISRKPPGAVNGVFFHRIRAGDDDGLGRYCLATERDVDEVFKVVKEWMSANLPAMVSWLASTETMIAAAEENHAQHMRAHEERKRQIAAGLEPTAPFPEGLWRTGMLEPYLLASRGDVDGVAASVAAWSQGDDGPGSFPHQVLAYARRRAADESDAGKWD